MLILWDRFTVNVKMAFIALTAHVKVMADGSKAYNNQKHEQCPSFVRLQF